jgi:hypothetical protein
MSQTAFERFWHTYLTREALLSSLASDDLKSLRLVCTSTAEDVAPVLFRKLSIHFETNTFTRQHRMLALERIGHHVKHIMFSMPRTGHTFLPPLIAPDSLRELSFVYRPQTTPSRPVSSSSSSTSSSTSSKYGSWEVEDLLVKHYPPLFHAATNIPAFCRAFNCLPNIRSLHISCPNRNVQYNSRRDAVDFALISLRVAVERANPTHLTRLVLSPLHTGAAFSLRPQGSHGSSPASPRIWRRIRAISIVMDSVDYPQAQHMDHLRILRTYVEAFHGLEVFDFSWVGSRGPFPLTLRTEPCITTSACTVSPERFTEISADAARRPCLWRKLRRMRVCNVLLDAHQAASFIDLHRKNLQEFNFEKCELRSGTWEDAVAPLNRLRTSSTPQPKREVLEVPLILATPRKDPESERIMTTLWKEHVDRPRGLHTFRRIGSRTIDTIPSQLKRAFKNVRLVWHN